MIERIVPKSEDEWLGLRKLDVTSTDVAALFGLSPYCTRFELWHRKHSKEGGEIHQNERMLWGIRLQEAVARGIEEDRGWKVRRLSAYMRDPDLRLGASFDYEVLNEDAILEIKCVDALSFVNHWTVDEDYAEAPVHIELQLQVQLMLSGKSRGIIGALVGGNRPVMIERKPDEDLQKAIRREVSAFWATVDSHVAPAPNFEMDYETVKRIYSKTSAGKVLDIASIDDCEKQAKMISLVEQYREASRQEGEATKLKESVKAELLTNIEDSEKVIGPDFTISAGQIAGCHVEFDRKPYRNFKIHWKKAKTPKGKEKE